MNDDIHRMTCDLLARMLLFVACVSSTHVVLADDSAFQPPPIQVPDGYVVELAAAPPLVEHPMMAGFDERGRLFIAESAGLNLKRAELEEQLPNFIRMLEDTDGDGRFDKSTIFADKLTFPMGALWHDGALYVASSGNIWKLQDTDGDGVADRREKLVSQFGYTGNAADVHGCFLGPTGRIFWCEGRHGHDIVDQNGNPISQGKAARIFSCRPDGSDIQVHCGGGMDNPVEIDWTDEGEMLGTVNLFYKQRGDCLVHWMHGGVYPRYDQEPVLAEFKRTGDLLPPVLDLGHVAVSGTTRYRSGWLDPSLRDNFFVTEFNTHKVVRVSLTRDGSSFRADKHEFLSTTSGDFHPTDVLEDADGSLLVIDTGGWFRNGCPVSQVAKPDVLGAIYRIRRVGVKAPDDPRGKKIDWQGAPHNELAKLLDDDRFAVRERAIAELAKRGDAAIDALTDVLDNDSERARRNTVWALARNGSKLARRRLQEMPGDDSESVTQAAIHAIGDLRDQTGYDAMFQYTVVGSPPVRREAATAVGRMKIRNAVPSLYAAPGESTDRMLEHAQIYAMIEINDPQFTRGGLKTTNPRIRRAALIALDQMAHGNLTRDDVVPLLDTSDVALQATALDVISRRPQWAGEIIDVLSKTLSEPSLDESRQAMIRGALAAFCTDDKVQSLVAHSLAEPQMPSATRRLLLEVMARSDLRPLPASWADQLGHSLTTSDNAVLQQAVATSAASGGTQFDDALVAISRDASKPADLRSAALAIVAAHGRLLDDASFNLLRLQLSEQVPPMQRLSAARALGAAKLSAAQQSAVIELVAKAGPLEITSLLGAFAAGSDAAAGHRLIAALSSSPGLAALSASALDALTEKYPADVREAAKPLLAKLRAGSEEQAARLAELESQISGGDPERGRLVFHSQRASCAACHRVGDTGGRIGPDLTKIGQSRAPRDLLEAILYPNSSLARGYESYSLTTTEGKILSGLITAETSDAIYLRTAQQEELRLRRSEIEAMLPSPLSIMPAGLENTMNIDQLRDLVAYLRSLR
jgi:putative membrane-bound dehydrogenase-like protein